MTEGGGPAIGSAAYRQLDGLHFECTVVDITYDHEHKPVMWTVQYADDDNTESVTDVSELNFDVQAVVDMRKHRQLFLDQFASFLPYLTPWERLTKCCVLCKLCQRATMQATLWQHVDLSFWPSTTPVGRYVNTVLNRLVYHDVLDKTPVKSIVDTLVLDGLPVTDQDLWGLMRQTPLLTSLSLVGCPYISFHLFPMCQNLQTTLALETVDLYLTFVQHASVMDVRNKFHRVVSFTSSGLQSLSPDISSHLLAQYTVTTWSNDRILFVDKDRLVLDHPNACSDELYAWPFSLVPVFQGDVSPTITPKSNPLSSSTAFMFRSLAHAGRFLDDLRVPESLATLVHRMKSSQSTTPRTRSKPVDPFDEHAKQVFASLYAWKTSLQAQVDDLSVAVAKAKEEHHVALTDYNRAELQRRHVEKAANRAMYWLTNARAVVVSPPPSGVIVNRPGDLDLPPLPSPDAIVALATTLALNQFAVCDAFLGEAMAIALYETLDNLHTYGGGLLSFERGVLAGGKTGRNLRYEKPSVRGDDVVWLDGSEASCPGIVKQTLRQLDRLVMERLANDELAECTLIRNKAMLTCYPGRGASYVKHCDNPNGNGRKVTAILYLNPAWVPAHGGELVIHHAHDTQHVVAPVLDRLLLFYSDARNPHEVRPTSAKRYAMTVWYMDWDEYTTTQVFADDDHNERTKIEREIEKFDAVAST
ncbi:hypothetical protein DYB34_008897 [Aphanomyces astaci]|uniref:Fe2OG dioxygenase domain-containing protein n=1 Tax=Aphanomyces astaci TaxID=112090 RepID=A0A418C3Y8_APHAT|nr:hypothetical protein DYB34_008897 [Aphanomyces astaci]